MTCWQDLMDYVYSEIEYLQFYKNYKPSLNNLLALANESLLGLTVDYISFTNSNAIEDINVIDIPNACDTIMRIELKGKEIKRLNDYEFARKKDRLYFKTGDYKIIFSEKINADIDELNIIGTGKFDLYTKDPNDKRVFELLPIQFHVMPAYFILSKLMLRAGRTDLAQYYLGEYNQLMRDYDWEVVGRRCTEATFSPMDYTKHNIENEDYKIIDNIQITVNEVPSLPPAEIDRRINEAVNSLANTVYTKQEADSKNDNILSQAKNYTYSKAQITSKDTITGNIAKSYTDEKVGNIDEALGEIIGEQE